MVTVAALVLPVLLGTHWFFAPNEARSPWLYRVLAFVLILMLFVIMVSAVQRMRLYIEVFGLTELRLYTTAFMGWLALVFLWFVATVLRGRRREFAFGALALGLGVLVFLNAMNPDEWIVSTNLNRPDATEPFDAGYAASLSADSVPMLLNAYPNLTQADKCEISKVLLDKRTPPQSFGVLTPPKGTAWFQPENWDWRTSNLGRIMAWQTVEVNWQNIVNACYLN